MHGVASSCARLWFFFGGGAGWWTIGFLRWWCCLIGVGFCTQQPYDIPPAGGCRCGLVDDWISALAVLLDRRWSLHPTAIRHPPCGGLPVTFLCVRQRKLTKRKPTLPGAEQSGCSAVVIASYGQRLRLACPTGLKGRATADGTGFVVRPLMAGAAPIRPSAVRGARGRCISYLAGLVVLSPTADTLPFDTLPYRRKPRLEIGHLRFVVGAVAPGERGRV